MMMMMMREAWNVDETSMKHVRVLGRGAYGSVSLEDHTFYGLCAKKTSRIKHKEYLDKELRIMRRFRNYSRIVQASSDRVHQESQECYILMEYASEGTLDKIISSYPTKSLPEHLIRRAARMILQGLQALHSNGYVHCDIKPSNVLAFPSVIDTGPWDLRLSDFGSAKEPNEDPYLLSGGTDAYMSPEVFEKRPYNVIDQAYDIWSLGCVVYQMFGAKPVKEDFEAMYDWSLDQDQVLSPLAHDFLKLCHGPHPMHIPNMLYNSKISPTRPTATELLTHPFVKQTLIVPSPTIPTIALFHCQLQEDNKKSCQNYQISSAELDSKILAQVPRVIRNNVENIVQDKEQR